MTNYSSLHSYQLAAYAAVFNLKEHQMHLIRQGCFESNSSSCHSISVNNTPTDFTTLYPNAPDGLMEFRIDLADYEFGWEEETYSDPTTKLAYVLMDCDYTNDRSPKLNSIIRSTVENHTGLKLVVTRSKNSYDEEGGYIDHESYGVGRESLTSQEKFFNFVFGVGSTLTTDNDNH